MCVSAEQKLYIKCRDYYEEQEFPQCPHGPTLLFHHGDESKGYYACAAFRNKRDCNFHLAANKVTEKTLKKRYALPCENYKQMRQLLLKTGNALHYCLNCNILLLKKDLASHQEHEIAKNLSKSQLANPTEFLRPLDDDKAQAQYFFDTNALKFFENCFIDLKITKVICVGAPRLHAYLRAHQASYGIRSFLLDLDYRFFYFFADTEFAWYNMCNNHFFDKTQEINFKQFLCDGKSNNENVLIFTDPPFGCRTEPIANTLRQLVRCYNKINDSPHQPLPIFWIFPYFAAHYIQQELPEMEMCDYKINYTNHMQYTNNNDKARKFGSPVRLFTNVPLEKIKLPVIELYKYCSQCKRYTALENRHCNLCGVCPSKNGSTYRHCRLCGRCVKSYYVHCNKCRRCAQAEAHNCAEYQAKQRCWICLQVGHTEYSCTIWQSVCKVFFLTNEIGQKYRKINVSEQNEIMCLICNNYGHNEQKCAKRNKYILEETFLGETEVTFDI